MRFCDRGGRGVTCFRAGRGCDRREVEASVGRGDRGVRVAADMDSFRAPHDIMLSKLLSKLEGAATSAECPIFNHTDPNWAQEILINFLGISGDHGLIRPQSLHRWQHQTAHHPTILQFAEAQIGFHGLSQLFTNRQMETGGVIEGARRQGILDRVTFEIL